MATNLFNSVKVSRPPSNIFDLTHDHKLSLGMGTLVPIMCLDCVPGDKLNISCESLLRFAPLVSPVMHRISVTMHYFYVPKRLLWPNFEKWVTNTKIEGALPAFPTIDVQTSNYSKVMDHLGVPTPIGANIETISAMPLAAYQMIYDEYYRDQNLIEKVQDQLGLANSGYLTDGDNTTAGPILGQIRKRAWEHDYFTSALPFAQKGDSVTLPIGKVVLNENWSADGGTDPLENYPHLVDAANNPVITGDVRGMGTAGVNAYMTTSTVTPQPVAFHPGESLNVTAGTINDLRTAERIQQWLEKAARGGTRLIEHIKVMFGVTSSDKRLQRPEYITGTKSPVVISEVLNTTGTAELPQGNQAGHAISVTQGKYGGYFCEEWGYCIGIMNVQPTTAYQQGMPKHFLKYQDPTQYYNPLFANLGEQTIENREIFAFQAGTAGDGTFGYIPRFAEHKFEANRVSGDFKSNLAHWTMSRIFATAPALNKEFIEADPTTRIFAVEEPDVDPLYCHVLNIVKASRLMPKYGTPMF